MPTKTDESLLGEAAVCLRDLCDLVHDGDEPVTKESVRGWAAKMDRLLLESRLDEARELNRRGPRGRDRPPATGRELAEYCGEQKSAGRRLRAARREQCERAGRGGRLPPGGITSGEELAIWCAK
jgi:hypothetical protein